MKNKIVDLFYFLGLGFVALGALILYIVGKLLVFTFDDDGWDLADNDKKPLHLDDDLNRVGSMGWNLWQDDNLHK